MSSYDAAKNGADSYDLAIGTLRARLENGFDPALSYAIATILPRREREAAAELVRLGFRTWLPMTAHWRRQRNGRKQERHEAPLWPGYLLVHLHAGCGRAQDVAPVQRFLTRDGQPATVPGRDLVHLHRAESAGLFDRTRDVARLMPGSEVRLILGSFADHVGTLQSMDGPTRCKVLINLFGTQRSVTTAVENVRALG